MAEVPPAGLGSTGNLLGGVRVLEFAQLLPGPFCAQILGDLGAEVIKVERPEGDAARTIAEDLFFATNRNKRSLALDLRDPAGREKYLELAAEADVLVESFRPGVASRLGVDYETVSRLNPKIVYCAISGYGQTGARRLDPGHDVNYIASGGGLHYAGQWGEPPVRTGIPLADLGAAHYGAVAVLAALLKRTHAGEGCFIDVSLTDAVLAMASVRAGRWLDISDTHAHLHPANDVFETEDGSRIALGALEDKFWEGLVNVVDEVEPALRDPRYSTIDDRKRYGDEISRLLRAAIKCKPADEWLRALREAGVPADPVLSPGEAVAAGADAGRPLAAEGSQGRYVMFPAFMNANPIASLRSEPPQSPDTDLARGWLTKPDALEEML